MRASAFSAALIILATAGLAFAASAKPPKTKHGTFVGTPESYREAGMWFTRLVDKKGKTVVHIGADGNLPENIRNCLGKATDGNYQVTVSGTLNIYDDGSKGMDEEKPMTCRKR